MHESSGTSIQNQRATVGEMRVGLRSITDSYKKLEGAVEATSARSEQQVAALEEQVHALASKLGGGNRAMSPVRGVSSLLGGLKSPRGVSTSGGPTSPRE